jgi:chromatin segregation and condensation protein Rec8/ScpA/Scc1 (kleisin family)
LFYFVKSGAIMSQRSIASIEDELATDDKDECVLLIEETSEDEKEKLKADGAKQPEDEAAAGSPQDDAESSEVETPSIESTDEDVAKTTAFSNDLSPAAQQKVADHLLQNITAINSRVQQSLKVSTLTFKLMSNRINPSLSDPG